MASGMSDIALYLGQSAVYWRGSRQCQEIRAVFWAGQDLHTKWIVLSPSRAEPTGTKMDGCAWAYERKRVDQNSYCSYYRFFFVYRFLCVSFFIISVATLCSCLCLRISSGSNKVETSVLRPALLTGLSFYFFVFQGKCRDISSD